MKKTYHIERNYKHRDSPENLLADAQRTRLSLLARGDNSPVYVETLRGSRILFTEITTMVDITNPEQRKSLQTKLSELTQKWLTTLPTSELAALVEKLEGIDLANK